MFIFSFGTSFQDTYCLLFRCICNPSQSISLNARLTKDKMFSGSTLLWALPGVNKIISPLITERLVAALPPPPLFQKLLRLSRILRHWFHTPRKRTPPSLAPPQGSTSMQPHSWTPVYSVSPRTTTTLATSPCWYSALLFMRNPSVDGEWLMDTPS